MSKTKLSPPSGIPTQTIILACIGWSIASLLFYLFLSTPTEGVPHLENGKKVIKEGKEVLDYIRPTWYRIGTYFMQSVAILAAGYLCLRNWRSPKIISGRNVWLGLGVGILSWGIGNGVFGYIDLSTGKAPDPPSLPDLFFVVTYIFLSWGMAMSVFGRRLNLYPNQWGMVAGVGVVGLAIAIYVTFFTDPVFNLEVSKLVLGFYALGDVWLLIVATILLLAFWGGKAAQSWRLLGGAGIAMFIADLGFAYQSKSPNYQSGDWIEFFWILAFMLWGMGAALEFDISSRPSPRRR